MSVVAEKACPKYLTIAGAAARASLSIETVRRLLRDGKLTRFAVGRRVLIAAEDLDRIIRGDGEADGGPDRAA